MKGHEEHGGSTEMYVNKTVIMLVWDNKEMPAFGKFMQQKVNTFSAEKTK